MRQVLFLVIPPMNDSVVGRADILTRWIRLVERLLANRKSVRAPSLPSRYLRRATEHLVKFVFLRLVYSDAHPQTQATVSSSE